MRAVVADGSGGITIAEVAEPAVGPGEVLVDVRATSLNRGELNRLASAPAGWRPGWDFAGVIADAGTSGALPGARVVGITTGGAWAQRVVAKITWLGHLDDSLDLAAAASLPTAGLTALRMLRIQPGTLGRRVLITGPSSGVGRFAIQLAHLGGAHVTALASSPDRTAGLDRLGCDEVFSDVAALRPPYDLALDARGGETPARLASLIGLDGTLVIYGNSSNQETVFPDVRDFYLGGSRRIQAFTIFHSLDRDPPGADLRFLAALVDRTLLESRIDLQVPWTDLPKALQRMSAGQVRGKLVLTID